MRLILIVLSAMFAMAGMPGDISGHMLSHEGIIKTEKREIAKEAALTLAASADQPTAEKEEVSEEVLFERAVDIIKEMESLHKAKHWPYVGYGHRARKGDGFTRGVELSEKQADKLLRKDLRVYLDMYKDFGKDAVLLAALAYNCGNGRVNSSDVLKKLKSGDRDIRDAYLSHSRAGGKFRRQLYNRRIAEYEALYIP